MPTIREEIAALPEGSTLRQLAEAAYCRDEVTLPPNKLSKSLWNRIEHDISETLMKMILIEMIRQHGTFEESDGEYDTRFHITVNPKEDYDPLMFDGKFHPSGQVILYNIRRKEETK